MAIDFDAASNGAQNSVTELTISHTCTGDNRILFVGVGIGSANDWITGITYNGSAMTRVNTQVIGSAANNRGYLYYILAPATSANNIVITSSNSVNIRAANASYTGVKQSGQPDAQGTTSTGSTNTITSTLTSIADNCWHVSFVNDDQGTLAASTGTTQRAASSPASSAIGDNNAAITPAGANSMTWTDTGVGAGMAVCGATFAPAAGSASVSPSISPSASVSPSAPPEVIQDIIQPGIIVFPR